MQKYVKAVNSRLKLLRYNWIMLTYLTPVKLDNIYINTPDTCFKCNSLYVGSDKIKKFCKEISNMIGHMV